jgi:hypothetical protein
MSTVAGAAVERGVFVAGANLAQKDFRSARSTTTQSLVALNKKFVAEGKAPVKIKEAPEALEDEDILEILNAGLVAVALVDKHIALLEADPVEAHRPRQRRSPDRRRDRLGNAQEQPATEDLD